MERIGVVGWNQETNIELVQAWCDLGLRATLLSPSKVVRSRQRGDVYLDAARALALAPSAVAA
jgi:hypothetical protein